MKSTMWIGRSLFKLTATLAFSMLVGAVHAAAPKTSSGGECGGANVKSAEVEATPQSGFHHPYLLFLPKKLNPGTPVLVALPTPVTSDDPADYLAAAERIAQKAAPMVARLDLPILIPVLPRPPVSDGAGGFVNLYIPALSRDAMLTTETSLSRMDRQVLAMVDDLRQRVARENGVKLQEKAIFVGFSAAGHFATRMAVLHPDRVLAVWAGGMGGHPILPLCEHDGRVLPYPVGVADLGKVAGAALDPASFRKVRMMIVQGESDTNSSLPTTDAPSDSYTFRQAETVRQVLGSIAAERISKARELYDAAGANAEFRTYAGAAHEITPDMARDLIAFVLEQAQPASRIVVKAR